MKSIILITSCAYHLTKNEQCRNTWLKQWNQLVDYKFVLGQGNSKKLDDELVLSVDDTYQGLPQKIQASHKWALEKGYDYILKTDCDVFMHVPRLFQSNFEKHPYSGNLFWPEAKYRFVLGSAYWLNKKASEILVKAKLPAYPAYGGDDVWVGRIMQENDIPIHHEPRYYVGQNPNWKDVISVHSTDLKMSLIQIQEKMFCA